MRAYITTLLKIALLLVAVGIFISSRLLSAPCTQVFIMREEARKHNATQVPIEAVTKLATFPAGSPRVFASKTKTENTSVPPLPDDIPLLNHSKTNWIPEKFFSAPRFCNNYTHKFIISNQHLCKDHKVLLLIGVRSHGKGYDSRALIRSTWGSVKEFKDFKVITVFVMGVQSNPSLQKAIEQENRINRDIVQADFVESYQNLTIKSQTIFKWMRDFCRHARYFMMTDTDLLVDIYKLTNYLNAINTQTDDTYILCKVEWTQKPFRPPRFGGHAAMPYDEYESENYATYCWGGAYVATVPLINRLYIASLHTPRLRIDDVWTGILAEKAGIKFPPTSDAYILPWDQNQHMLQHQKYYDGPIIFVAWHGYATNRKIKLNWAAIAAHHKQSMKET